MANFEKKDYLWKVPEHDERAETENPKHVSVSAKRLKDSSDKAPAEFFEPLHFGELDNGERFIVLSTAGDNHGHGGFRRPFYLFMKMEPFQSGISMCNAIKLSTSTAIHCTDRMPVVRVI